MKSPFKTAFSIHATLVGLIYLAESVLGVSFHLYPHSKRCLKHEMYANQLAVGNYDVSSLAETSVDLTITDSKGHIALKRENIDGKGKFAVTSDTSDYYELCFHYSTTSAIEDLPARDVTVDYRVGAEAKQYEEPTLDHDQLQRDLDKIEDLTNAVIIDFAYLKKREQEMSDTNESTNNRLFYQTVTSVIILLVLTTWQVIYLRQFFRQRKLID